jgi:uncharacterized protein YjbI with pentapeptide repeats
MPVRRKFDDWYYRCQSITEDRVRLSDYATACWTRTGEQFSRGTLLRLLRSGHKQWNKWRRSLPDLQWYTVSGRTFWRPGFVIRLPHCDLRRLNLSNYELVGIDFTKSSFTKSKFRDVDFHWLSGKPIQPRTELNQCCFRSADLTGTCLNYTSAIGCDFSHADLNGTEIVGSNLSSSIFFKTFLAATFENTNIANADFDGAYLMCSTFVNVDLGRARGIGGAHAYPPLTLDVRTLLRSGVLPRNLYRACGMSDRVTKSLKRTLSRKVKRVRCFVSYSSRDQQIVEMLKSDLEEHGIETWFAPRDLHIGAETRPELDKAILNVDKLVIVLSRRSIVSE